MLLYMNKIIIAIIILILCIICFAFPQLNTAIIFHPVKPTNSEYKKMLSIYGENMINLDITSNKYKLNGFLFNSKGKPSWDDYIFIYCHGNAGWLNYCLQSDTFKMLSDFGSIYVFDYRGYGKSEGIVTEEGLYEDIKSVWNYLVKNININPKKIILYGHSLGSSIVSYLTAHLADKHNGKSKFLPSACILEAPFLDICTMASHIHPLLSYCVTVNLNNLKNVKTIKNSLKKFPIIIFHSKDDEVIPINHSEILSNTTGSYLHYIEGTHNEPKFSLDTRKIITKLLEDKDIKLISK